MTRLWDKGAPLDARVLAYTAGEDYLLDERLVGYDVQASLAHARMLQSVGLLTVDECRQIERGLLEIQAEIETGQFVFVLEREDIHMHIEAALVETPADAPPPPPTAFDRAAPAAGLAVRISGTTQATAPAVATADMRPMAWRRDRRGRPATVAPSPCAITSLCGSSLCMSSTVLCPLQPAGCSVLSCVRTGVPSAGPAGCCSVLVTPGPGISCRHGPRILQCP